LKTDLPILNVSFCTIAHFTPQLGDIAIIPAGIAHRCNWNTTAQFGILAIEPTLLQQIGQDWINPDSAEPTLRERIELMPQFMSKRDDLNNFSI
jgi:AraC family transcriptional regulator